MPQLVDGKNCLIWLHVFVARQMRKSYPGWPTTSDGWCSAAVRKIETRDNLPERPFFGCNPYGFPKSVGLSGGGSEFLSASRGGREDRRIAFPPTAAGS